MIIYSANKTSFMDESSEVIASRLRTSIRDEMHRYTPDGEYRAWVNSLGRMQYVLNDPQIPNDAGIAIEYNIPQTEKRIDFLISGYDEEDDSNVVIIELKQWDRVALVVGKPLVETYTGGGIRHVVHPSYQAWSYAKFVSDYNSAVEDDAIKLWPCAYLHNYWRMPHDPLDDEIYAPYKDKAPAFTGEDGQMTRIRRFISSHISRGDARGGNGRIFYMMENGTIRPSKSLQDSIGKMLEGNQEFILLDEQRVVYEEALDISRKSAADGKKRVVIVRGGPGTGKSVVAVNLLAQLTKDGQFCQYVSKNDAPRNCYKEKLKGHMKMVNIDAMFRSPDGYYKISKNSVGTILADEAHRLREKSGRYNNEGENQIKEIIDAAMCSVFFVDESQRVTLKDIGSVEEIRRRAAEAGVEEGNVTELELVSQFRCNGSDGYLSWLDNVLEIRPTANDTLEGIDFDFRVFDTPGEVRDLIFEKNRGRNKSRLVAGFCWEWDVQKRNDPDHHDIVIGDFSMSWNLHDDATYAISEGSVDQVGCIHTVQGLEFDYVGVIIGDDMRFEDGHIVTDRRGRAKRHDISLNIPAALRNDPERVEKETDEVIKNTYRVLMTRGMKGCYVYCTDRALAEHLRESVSPLKTGEEG